MDMEHLKAKYFLKKCFQYQDCWTLRRCKQLPVSLPADTLNSLEQEHMAQCKEVQEQCIEVQEECRKVQCCATVQHSLMKCSAAHSLQ